MNAAPGAATRRGQALPLRLLGTSAAPTVKTDSQRCVPPRLVELLHFRDAI